MRKVELRPLDTNQPGYGQLVIIGWQDASEGLSVDIQRNQDEYFLQDDGQWRSNAFRFHLPALSPTAEGHLAAAVDHQLVDPLLENSHATNMARFYGPDGTQVGMARLRLGQGLMPSGASGSASTPAASAALTPPEPSPTPPEPAIEAPAPPEPTLEPTPEPVTEAPEPAPAAAGTSQRGLWILLAVVLLAALIGAAAWFGFSLGDREAPPGVDEAAIEEPLDEPEATPAEAPLPEEPTPDETDEAGTPEAPPPEETAPDEATEASAPEAPAPEEPAPLESAAVAAPCSLQRMGESDELAFIQGCAGAGSEVGNMLEVITEARDNGHCGIARRLYAHQALNGDAAAALAYAREFDPARHAPSACFPEADAETALFWYETALGVDPDNAEAGQRLEELQG
ncbi:hypothetical protein ACFQH5_14605 [Halomonas salifodinae]|uniref:Sel1 repeat family protein n=1 Tax=Halomonas salifodinae TaxID=438745 RepID=A0ABW2EXR1_9GAMM